MKLNPFCLKKTPSNTKAQKKTYLFLIRSFRSKAKKRTQVSINFLDMFLLCRKTIVYLPINLGSQLFVSFAEAIALHYLLTK